MIQKPSPSSEQGQGLVSYALALVLIAGMFAYLVVSIALVVFGNTPIWQCLILPMICFSLAMLMGLGIYIGQRPQRKRMQHRYDLRAWNLKDIIQQELHRYRQQIRDRNINIVLQEVYPTVTVKKMHLSGALAHLISNAIKYIGDDNPHPEIKIFATQDGDTIRVEIQDNGIGLSEAEADEVFRLLYRGSDAKQTAYGFGVGLSLAKRNVDSMGGDIGIERNADNGITVWFTIPIKPKASLG